MMRSAVVPVVMLGALRPAPAVALRGARAPATSSRSRSRIAPASSRCSTARRSPAGRATRPSGGPRAVCWSARRTADKPLPANTFLIWTQGAAGRLRAEARFPDQRRQHRRPVPERARAGHRPVRAEGLSGRHRLRQPVDRSALRGARPRLPGAARPGDVQRAATSRGSSAASTPADAIKAAINVGGWNTIHIIARGDLVVHAINGKVSAVFLDGDKAKRPSKGFIGLQLHTGPPMRAEFRNVSIRTID